MESDPFIPRKQAPGHV